MIAPLLWYMFVDSLDSELSRVASYELAIAELFSEASPKEREQLKSYFKAASEVPEEDCRLIQAESIEFDLYFVPEGKTCREFYLDTLEIFLSNEMRR